jgi:hypothetical protein
MNYELRKSTDNEEWDAFVLKSPQNNIYCMTDFLDSGNQDYDCLFVVKGELILLGALIIKKKSKESDLVYWPYQGVLLSEYVESISSHKKNKICLSAVQFLLTELESIYSSTNFSLHHSLIDLRAFQWHNYNNDKGFKPNLVLKYTGILRIDEVQNFNEILANVRTVRRQEYKKCIKNGFKIEQSTDVGTLTLLSKKTFERQGLKISTQALAHTENYVKKILSKNIGRLTICKNNLGAPVSACLFLFDNKTGYYHIGGSDPDYRNEGISSYTLLDQIHYCLKQGLSSIDFMGINSPNRGDFKTSFNADPKTYFDLSFEK